jgi:putative ABC transport system permease protein
VSLIESVFRDIGYAVRVLRKTPAITAVALLSLALGIGANTAIFSLMDAVLLRMLPVQKPEELVQVGFHSPRSAGTRRSYTNTIWEQVRDHQDLFSGVFAWSPQSFDLADGGEAQPIRGIYVSGSYFTTLGVRPAIGRLLMAADDSRGCGGAVILGYNFWQQHYGGADSAIGSLLRLNGHTFPVIGVTQRGFFGTDVGDRFDVAIPICAEAVLAGKDSMLDQRSSWWLLMMGRLKPGVSIAQATARLNLLAPEIFGASIPQFWSPTDQRDFRQYKFTAEFASTGLTGYSNLRDQYERPLEILMAVVGLVLLIACANIASLTMARSAARQKEIAVRLSLGASRRRLMRQVLTESFVLSGAGALLGLLFARWGGALLVRLVSTTQNKLFLDLSMDVRVLGFTIVIAILTGILFGVIPAFRATHLSLTSALKGGEAQPGDGRSQPRSARWVVAVQVALSIILLVGTLLFARTFRNLLILNPGFDRNNVLLASMNVHNAGIPTGVLGSFYAKVLNRLQAIPGTTSVSQVWFTPFSGMEWNNNVQVEGYQPPPGQQPLVWFNWVTPGYFATLRTPILLGRSFDAHDTATSSRVAIVNETMAHQFFPNANPIGSYFSISGDDPAVSKPLQIVGIVKDSKYLSLREVFSPFAYVPSTQIPFVPEETSFAIRTAINPTVLISAVRDAIGSENKAASLRFATLGQLVDDTLVQERLLAMLSGFFGGLALLLTAIGLYGVMTYFVTRRTREIGIRMALGARPRSILQLVMRDVLVLLAAGIGAGVVASFWVTRLAQQLLFGLSPTDTATFLLAVGGIVMVALVASYLPARRAIRVDPMVALRDE